MAKPIIYQLFPRLYTNSVSNCVPNGSIEENGCGKMNEITPTVLRSIRDLGVTHVWYTGVIEHAHKTDYTAFGITKDNAHVVKGNAGSPYAIKDYYDIDPDIAVDVPNRIEEFKALVRRTHECGMKVIIDFVPNHVARCYHSDAKPVGISDFGENDNKDMFFCPNNNFYYIPRQQFAPTFSLGEGDDEYVEFPAKATGNDCFTAFPGQNDWYETVKLNYGVDYGNGCRYFNPTPDTWFKMLHILRYWAGMGIDGFRCDMVCMVPVDFWRWAIPQVKEKYPDLLFIAEIYDVGQYRDYIYNGHFDYLYDKVNLYDRLRAIMCSNVSAANITSCWQTVDGISDYMLNFLENHDEQRIASEQFAGDAVKAKPALVVSATMSRAAMMIYQGQELGEKGADSEGFSGCDGRTTIFDYWSVPTLRRRYNEGKCDTALLSEDEVALMEYYKRVLTLCTEEKAISEGGFFDLMYVNYENVNPHKHFVYLRHIQGETLLILANFDDNAATVQVEIPKHAFECLNLTQGQYDARELLHGDSKEATLCIGNRFEVSVNAYDAVIWKFTPKKFDPKRHAKEKITKTTK